MVGVPAPFNGAGLVGTDPDQAGVVQDPDTVMFGDLDELPELEPLTPLLMVNDVVIDGSER